MARKRTNAPTKPDDVRAQRSIEALRLALLELLKTKPFEQILIREIADAAGVSNPTFFRRFASKDDLLEDIAKDEIRSLLSLGQSAFDQRDPQERSGEALCAFVQEHRRLWTILLTGGAAPAMRSEFLRVAEEIGRSRRRTNPWLPLDLATAFTTSGIFEILAWWMRQPADYPITNVVKLFDALIIDSVGRPRKISLTSIVRPTLAVTDSPDQEKAASDKRKKPVQSRNSHGDKR